MSKLRQALNSLPKTLDETYDRILSKIDPDYTSEVLHVLHWLTHSRRPLSLEEVAEVFAFSVESDSKFNYENRLADPRDILYICSSLVIGMDTDNDDKRGSGTSAEIVTSISQNKPLTIKLAHFSVKEYLVSDRIRRSSAAFFSIDGMTSNAVISATSLSCLLLYDKALFSSAKEFSEEFPLANYSAMYWNEHIWETGTLDPDTRRLAVKLFLSEVKMRNWIALYNFGDDVLDAKKHTIYPRLSTIPCGTYQSWRSRGDTRGTSWDYG